MYLKRKRGEFKKNFISSGLIGRNLSIFLCGGHGARVERIVEIIPERNKIQYIRERMES